MKVLHFYRTYYPDTFGGVEQVIRQMAVGTARLGVENEVLTLTRDADRPLIEFEGHKVHRAHLNFEIASTGFSWSALSRFVELAKQADVIHYHFPWPFMDIAHFLGRIKKPSVVTYHSDIVRQKYLLKLYSPLKHQFLRDVNRIVATSPNYLATSPTLELYKDKTEVITYGLDNSIYPVPSAELLAKWRAIVGENFFLFVGMLRYYKGLHILLEAAAGTDIPIVIVGDGPEEIELKRQAESLQLKNVHFLGALPEPDKVALLTLCYALAFPSHLRSEAFGISLLEGAMYGKPMISSEIGTGTTYINVAGQTGMVVPPSDPAAFRQAMEYLLAHPQEAAQMGINARQRYLDLFTADKMASNYARLYQQVIDEHKRK
ncbi:glycosyltransferase WbpZ [Undibacterium sp. YM2]|uniref:glycosyltransferase family 4 protein n=1 Tax=unclassified Undibacterium TaxID=2630295 RepID=UPI001331F717|nr:MULTISPECIES: glycosyltransferase family 4 protein [unclassified Undibacterium]BBB63558.1 glycosyltransferase WbpZ [Undibacterium sp. KW1]BBB69515.1 glycosyltransferase WbpZ [Undibacterium sp. YM2]